MSIFDKWNQNVDKASLKAEMEQAKQSSGDYVEVPHGLYEVKVDKMELKESKSKGEPMVAVRFRILTGPYNNQCIFMNQVVTRGFQIHLVNEFLESLKSGVPIEWNGEDYADYNELILNVQEAIDGHKEYVLEYGQNKKGYNTFTIEDVFEV